MISTPDEYITFLERRDLAMLGAGRGWITSDTPAVIGRAV